MTSDESAETANVGIVSAETPNIGTSRRDGLASDNAPRREHVIYAITHISSGRRYIGRSINELQRIYTHKSNLRRNRHWCPELQGDWNTDGKSAFSFEILERDIYSEEHAKTAEISHIAASCKEGRSLYNYHAEINPETGRLTLTDLGRQKQSELIKAAWADPTSDLRNPRRRRWDDPAQREIQSASQKKRYTDPAERKKTSEAMKAVETEKSRQRKSEASKSSWAGPNSPQRAAIPKRTMSEEGRAAKAAKIAAYWASPKGQLVRLARSEKLRAYWSDPTSALRNRRLGQQ